MIAQKILKDMLQNSKLIDANLTTEQKVMVALGWLDYTCAKRLDKLNLGTLKWNAAVAIASSAAATFALLSLLLLLIGAG